MPNVVIRSIFPKNEFSPADIAAERQERLALPGVISCELTEDAVNYLLTTTFPDPNEGNNPSAAATMSSAAVATGGTAGVARSFPTPRDAITLCIETWEGLWQANPADSGNFAHCQNGSTKLVGTMRGVTPDAFARFHGMDPCSVTETMLRGTVTSRMAADIAMRDYFEKYNFHTLLWCPIVDIAFDVSFLSGTGRGIKMLQELIGANIDGGIGPQTIEALEFFVESHDIKESCDRFADMRIAFYESISQPGTKNAQFRKGWTNRANWARPSNAGWWSRWDGWVMPHPAGSSKATGLVTSA